MKLLDVLAASRVLGGLLEGIEAREPRTKGSGDVAESVEEGPVGEDTGSESDVVCSRNEQCAEKRREDAETSGCDIREPKSEEEADVAKDKLPGGAVDLVRSEGEVMGCDGDECRGGHCHLPRSLQQRHEREDHFFPRFQCHTYFSLGQMEGMERKCRSKVTEIMLSPQNGTAQRGTVMSIVVRPLSPACRASLPLLAHAT